MGPIPSALRRGNIHAEVRVAAQLYLGDSSEPAGTGESCTSLTINRIWQRDDTLEFTLRAEIRVNRCNGKGQNCGQAEILLEYGSVLLAVVGASTADIPAHICLTVEEIALGRRFGRAMFMVRSGGYHIRLQPV